MKNQIPVNSCETGKKCSSCSPCMKKMMFLIPLVLILMGGFYVYSNFFAHEKTSHEVDYSLSETGQYANYSEEKYNELLGKKPFALFFHASWCPTCRAEEKLIQENISSFPKDFTILKADYDTETELKKKYGITMQSIVVVLDETGKEVGRIGDFSSIEKLTDIIPKSYSKNSQETKDISDNKIITEYSENTFQNLLGKEKFALFFSASWCPKCQATKKSIQENPEKFSSVKLLDIDYDNATTLKQKYGITLQHSLVFFNADGSIAGKSVMPSDDEVIEFFTKNILPSQKSDDKTSSNTQINAQYQEYSESKYNELLGKTFCSFLSCFLVSYL